jgi:thiol-disulfide isomerase/thioredoxin
MKKNFLSLLLLFVTVSTFSQKTIDKPDYGMSNIPGSITKIELTPEATILHLHIEYRAGYWIYIPKESFIKDINGGEKLLVVKAAGIPLNEKYTMPESGQVDYQLYFPRLPATVNTIDFGEANEGGSWAVNDIVINEEQEKSLLLNELQGNWLLADGSNQWQYGFYKSKAIVDKAIWNYQSVKKDKKSYTILLERNGKQKTIFAQIDPKKGTSFGSDKKQMQLYSTTKIDNPNYKLANDPVFSNSVLKTDSTTYSGVIKGYSTRTKIKTGAVHVNNVFTGEQDTYVVKIAEDGSFSVKFPIDHPQSIYVRLPNFNSDVFVEPSKETFQLIDGENTLFMGDCARVNTDLKTLGRQSYEEYDKLRKNIFQTSPEEYKNACLSIKNKEIETLNQTIRKQFISQKAIQIKKLDIEYGTFGEILLYEMFRERPRNKENDSDAKPKQDYKLEASYYDFITESVLNDQIAVIGINYSSFVNRLKYAQILRSRFSAMSYNSIAEIADQLQKSGVVLTKEELEMATESKKLDASRSKFSDFYNANASKIGIFIQKYKEDYARLRKEKPKTLVSVSDLATSLKAQGISLSAEEIELEQLYKSSLPTKEEEAQQKEFTAKYGEKEEAFNEKYKTNIQEITNEKDFNKSQDKFKEVFGVNEAFVFDIFTVQDKSQELERNSIPYTDKQIKGIQSKIKHPLLSNYIVLVNDELKAKIEANKKQTGFAINTVMKTEEDELFDSMIAKFKGKVIYVDFWATWCGPCMQGIKEIAPLKEEMKNENVVFLYITNQTSPENTWNAKIPDIKGEHYRVSEDEWNYLAQKFNISGIPHYALVNKNGEIVKSSFRPSSNEELKAILEKELK